MLLALGFGPSTTHQFEDGVRGGLRRYVLDFVAERTLAPHIYKISRTAKTSNIFRFEVRRSKLELQVRLYGTVFEDRLPVAGLHLRCAAFRDSRGTLRALRSSHRERKIETPHCVWHDEQYLLPPRSILGPTPSEAMPRVPPFPSWGRFLPL